MLGHSLDRIVPAGSSHLATEIADARRYGRGGGEEGWRMRKDGSRIWAVGEVAPIREADEIVGYVEILRDLTQQRLIVVFSDAFAGLPSALLTRLAAIIGIGASAGGVDAFHSFFDALPPDCGMAFVMILHLPADHKSMLTEILSRWTAQ
jgi:chemotaxis response regulator CheB